MVRPPTVTLKTWLTAAGAIPFLFFSILLALNVSELPYLGDIEQGLLSYGVIIATFIAGSHWGIHLKTTHAIGNPLAFFSNAITIGLWLTYWLCAPTFVILFLCLNLIILLLIEYKLLKQMLIGHAYFKLRCTVTSIVVISLLISRI